MSLNPFGKGLQISLSDVQDEMNRMFDRMWHGGISTAPLDGQEWAPAIDLVNEPSRYVLTAEVPGLNVEEIEVALEDGQIVLKGNKQAPHTRDERPAFLRRERRYGSFRRAITLPEVINPEQISAKCQNGVLEVILPKKDSATRKTIRVEGGE